MTPGEQYERFEHLIRLSRALHGLGVCTALVLPVAGQPVLEIRSASGTLARIIVVWRSGWVFTWRPWWARLWPWDRWVVAHADNAADIIMAEVGAGEGDGRSAPTAARRRGRPRGGGRLWHAEYW